MAIDGDVDGPQRSDPTISLIEKEHYWVAIHEPTNVGAQGETRDQALAELDEAVALHAGDAGEPIDDEDAFLREIGIDPDEIADSESPPPWEA